MSTDYYLSCPKCEQSVGFTDNKGQNWIKPKEMRHFLTSHYGCDVILESDIYFDYDWSKSQKASFDKSEKEHEEWEKQYLKNAALAATP